MGWEGVTGVAEGKCRAVLQDLLLGVSERGEDGFSDAQVLERGLKLVLDGLDQTAVDVPFAPDLVRPPAPPSPAAARLLACCCHMLGEEGSCPGL